MYFRQNRPTGAFSLQGLKDCCLCRERDHGEGHKSDSHLSRHSWGGEASSGPARVHVLHCIEEQKWHQGEPTMQQSRSSETCFFLLVMTTSLDSLGYVPDCASNSSGDGIA